MSNAKEILDDLPFEVWEEGETREVQEVTNLEFNPFTEQYTDKQGNVLSIEEFKERNNPKTAPVSEKEIALANELATILSADEEENKKSTGSDTDAFEEMIITDLKNYELQFNDIDIEIDFERLYYFILDESRKVPQEVRLSNFVILPLYSIKAENGNQKLYTRLIKGDSSIEVVFDGEKLANNKSFKTFVREYGSYNWRGNQQQLNDLNDLLSAYPLDEIEEKTYAGWHKKEGVWLFPDRAYYKGNVYPMVDDKVTISGKSFTFDHEVKSAVRVIREHTELPEDKNQITDVVKAFLDLYQTFGYLGIGWVIASFVADDISTKKLAGQFPILSPYGIFKSGKTAFSRLLSELAGIDTPMTTEPSKDVWRKDVHAFSCLPIMYDEFKEERGPRNPFVVLRSFINKTFDRGTLKKGNLSRFGTEEYEVHATVTLIGEVPTTDSAVLSRFIYIDSTKFQKDKALYNKVKNNQSILNAVGQYFMRTSDDWKDSFISSYKYFLDVMEDRSIKDDRMEVNYAIVLAGAKTFMEMIDKLVGKNVLYSDSEIENLLQYVESQIRTNGQELRQAHPSMQFLEDIGTMVGEFEILKTSYKVLYNYEFEGKQYEKVLMLAPRSVWNSYKKRIPDAFYSSNIQIKKDLQTYPFFLGSKSFRVSSELSSAPTCWVIDLTNPLLPPEMQNFISIRE